MSQEDRKKCLKDRILLSKFVLSRSLFLGMFKVSREPYVINTNRDFGKRCIDV